MNIAGVDGCRAGWVAVIMPTGQPAAATCRVFAQLGDLLALPDAPHHVAVDMPIGLPDFCGPGGRVAEVQVRTFLGRRRSSVFAIPSRSTVYAPDYTQARLTALATSNPPRSVSKQAFHIFPKIREIDGLMRNNPVLGGRVRECHPEASFCTMAGAPLAFAKKHAGGVAERLALLTAQGFKTEFLQAKLPRNVGRDDLLDACAAAFTAGRIATGAAVSFPQQAPIDSFGLPMAIWA